MLPNVSVSGAALALRPLHRMVWVMRFDALHVLVNGSLCGHPHILPWIATPASEPVLRWE